MPLPCPKCGMLMIEIPTPKSGVLSCCASCGHTQNAKGVPVVPSPTKTEEKPPQLRITATDIPPEVQALLDMERAKIDARFDGYEKDEQKIFGLLRDVPGANFLSNLLSRFF